MSVLAVINIKGGVGKTTTAVHLAWLAARDGTPTLLWDLDPQGAASFILRVKPELPVKWSRLLRDPTTLAAAIKGTDHDGLDLLPGDESCRRLDDILRRADERGRALGRALAMLGDGYAHVLLDCPPGFSFLAENVFNAADALLVPTIPTVLSLRTLAQLARHVAGRRGRCPQLLPFLNMVDRHKALHRDVSDHVQRTGGPRLTAPVPYASALEQMAVQRAPAGATPAGASVLRDIEQLWAQVRARLARPQADADRRNDCLRLAEDVERLERALQQEARGDSPTATGTGPAPDQGDGPPLEGEAGCTAPSTATAPRSAILTVPLTDEVEVDSLLLAAGVGAGPGGGVERLIHEFDTGAAALRAAGFTLRLCEEGGCYRVTASGPLGGQAAHAAGAARGAPEPGTEVAGVDAAWARRILSGESSPLPLLVARAGGRLSPLLAELVRLVGGQSVARVSSSRSLRRSVSAADLSPAPGDEALAGPVALTFERIEGAEGRTLHALLVDVAPETLPACERALRHWFRRAGIPWRTAGGANTIAPGLRDAPAEEAAKEAGQASSLGANGIVFSTGGSAP